MTQVLIGRIEDFPEATPTRVEADGNALCVIRVADAIYVVCDDCPHAEASLSEGEFLAGGLEIECPLHGSTFHLETGEPSCPPATEAVEVYAVTISGDDVFVDV